MCYLNVNDVIYREKHNKILIQLKNKLLFCDETPMLKNYDYLQNMFVYSYEYLDIENKILLIIVIDDILFYLINVLINTEIILNSYLYY